MKSIAFALLLFSTMSYAQDFANFGRYQKQNQEVLSQNIAPNSVLMGDSITEGWFSTDPEFLPKITL
jgi:hypothetical protein